MTAPTMKTSNHELPLAATTTTPTTTTLCDVNDSVEQHIAIDSTSDDQHHDFEHSSIPSNALAASTSTSHHFSADSTAPSSSTLEQQQQQQQRFYRSNSLIRIELDNDSNDDDSSSISNSSSDNGHVIDVNRSASTTRRQHVSSDRSSYGHSYPHSDTECSPEPSSSTSITTTSSGLNKDKKLTVLQPYNNQVGGHTQLMLLDQSTLCKPLVQRELLFYLNIPRELQEYVPNYKGVVEIRYCENNFPTLYHPHKRNNSSPSVPSAGSAASSSTSLAVPGSWNKPELKVQLCTCNDRRLLQQAELNGGTSGPSPSSASARSELSNCYSSRPSQRYFMLLENITSHYHLPCILDLKMGTRQHGEDASDEKRHRQMAKCAATTSASLGVRICGMQTYHKVADNNYRLYQVDKYYGRRIKNESGLQNELEIYFKNRPYLIGPVVKRLKELKSQVLATLRKRALRFYSTSLLIVSEGCSTAHRNRPIFKHHNSDGEEEDEEDYEEEYFHDGDDLEDFESDEEDHFEDHDDEEEEEVLGDYDDSNDSNSSSNDTTAANVVLALDDSSADSSDVLIQQQPSLSAAPVSTTSPIESRYVPSKHYVCNRDHRRRSPPSKPPAPEFDVRMIDFAHTCFSSGSSTDGFTVGLENLIRLLNNIRGRGQQQKKSESAGEVVVSSSGGGRNGKKRRRSSGHDSHQHNFRSHHHTHHNQHNHHHHQEEEQHYSSRALKKNSSQALSSPDFLFSEETVMEPPNCDVTA